MLRVVYPAGRTLRVKVSMDENMLNLVDRAAGERKLTRSAFIAEASRRFAMAELMPGGRREPRVRGF